MKKMLLIAAAAALLLTFSACGSTFGLPASSGQTASNASQAQTASTATSEDAPEADQAKVEDNLDGMVQYLSANGVLKTDGAKTDMEAAFIGAKTGVKYTFSNEGTNNVVIELYEYDPANISAEAKAVLEGVQSAGSFSLMSQTVTNSYVSDSGKYMMIYVDSQNGEKNISNKDKAIELFKGFKK